ncbi:MAG: MFS transporter, partial [Candidatus Dormibacteraceae bacterium]
VLALGSAITVGAILTHSAAGLLAGTAVAGAGFGMSFLGAFRLLAALATPEGRGALLGTAYVVAYLSFSLPAIAAGVAATDVGLHETSIVFGAIVAFLSVLASLAALRAPRRPRLAALPPGGSCPPTRSESR